jgi:CubicO group peptidase (beta-lactamase class C family)
MQAMRLDQLLPDLVARREAPGVAAVLFEGDRIIWSGAAGVRAMAGESSLPTDLTVETKARVASVSKIVTALTLIVLAQEGRIDLDSDCSQQLGFELRHPRYPRSPISARMALSHTSGARDGNTYRGVIGETLEGFFRPGGARYEDGGHWGAVDQPLGYFTYANIGMGLVAQLAERIAGQRFDLFAKDRVLAPLGATAGFNWSGVSDADAVLGATLYRRTGDGPWIDQVDASLETLERPTLAYVGDRTLADYRLGENGLIFSPQGGLRASVMDLAAIGMALSGAKPLLSAQTRAMIAEPVWRRRPDDSTGDPSGGGFRAFGTGVHIVLPEADGPVQGLARPLIGHYGDAYGLLAGLWVDQASGKGFAWFCTGSPTSPAAGRSGIYAVEEAMMQAACADLGLLA